MVNQLERCDFSKPTKVQRTLLERNHVDYNQSLKDSFVVMTEANPDLNIERVYY